MTLGVSGLPDCPPALRRPRAVSRTLRVLGAVCFAAAACSCTVGFWNYQQVQAPDAGYRNVGCNGKGPPSLTYYPFHGIFIAVSVSPLQLSLNVPRDLTASLDGDTVVVTGRSRAGGTSLTLHLQPFQPLPRPPDTDLAVQNYDERPAGAAAGTSDSQEIIDRMTLGTIRLPALTIAGRTYPPQELPFMRRSYSHLMSATATCSAPP